MRKLARIGCSIGKAVGVKGNIRLLIVGVVVVVVLAFAVLRGDQLEQLAQTVRTGAPVFLALAVAAQMGKYVAQGHAYVFCFRAVDEPLRFIEGFKLVFGTFFTNTVAPSLNLAGATLVVDDSAQRGVPAGKATSAALFMQLTIDSGFVIIMAAGFIVLALTVGLQPDWLLLGLLAVALVGCLVTVMLVGGLRPDVAKRLLHPVERLANRVLTRLKRKPLDGAIDKLVDSFSSAAKHIAKSPRHATPAFGCSIIASMCELLCFSFAGLAFGIRSPEALVCGYVVATLFAMISFVPQGVGVVEAAVLVAFSLFGVGKGPGMAAVLVYRAIVFWIPFLTGAIVVQRMGTLGKLGKGNEG